MQLTKEQVIEILHKNSFKAKVYGVPTTIVGDADFNNVAEQILSLLQPSSEPTPAVSAMQCYAGKAAPLALLEQELNRLAAAMPPNCSGLPGFEYGKKIGRVQDALQLIRELTAKANGA